MTLAELNCEMSIKNEKIGALRDMIKRYYQYEMGGYKVDNDVQLVNHCRQYAEKDNFGASLLNEFERVRLDAQDFMQVRWIAKED